MFVIKTIGDRNILVVDTIVPGHVSPISGWLSSSDQINSSTLALSKSCCRSVRPCHQSSKSFVNSTVQDMIDYIP